MTRLMSFSPGHGGAKNAVVAPTIVTAASATGARSNKGDSRATMEMVAVVPFSRSTSSGSRIAGWPIA